VIGHQIKPPPRRQRHKGPPREKELEYLLLNTGLEVKQIAFRMNISAQSAKQYCSMLLRKRGVGSRVELMHLEIQRLKTELEKRS
jgi:DNA-binding NarL/FixJ family response regulator